MKKWKQYLNPIFLIYILSGAVCGFITADLMDQVEILKPFGGLAIAVLIFYFLFVFEIVIHEGGHLVAGLLSGYSFVSFRVFSWLLAKEEGKMKLKRFSLAGTAGQCLLDPPEMKNGRIPVKLYNMGGVLANLITAAAGFIGVFLAGKGTFAFDVFLIMAVLGVAYALANGIPFSTGMVNNDGFNVRYLDRNLTAMGAFYNQLKINAEQAKGVRLNDMPEEWFEMPSDENLKETMSASQAVLACNRLLERQDFEATAEQIEILLGKDTAVMGLHEALLVSDLVYCLLMLGADEEKIRKLLDKNQRKVMKSMAALPCIQRSEYAIALLLDGDKENAAKIRTRFMKMEKSYPYKAEFRSERSLLEKVEEKI